MRALRHRRRRIHRLELRPPRARRPPTTRSRSSTPSPTRATWPASATCSTTALRVRRTPTSATPTTSLRAMDGHDAVVHFAAESHVDRSIDDGSTFVGRTASGPTCCATSPTRRGRHVPAHLDRRGLRLGRAGLVARDRRARAALAVLGGEGRLRPDRAVVPRDLRPAGRRHPVLEQLRAVPVPREGHPAVHDEPARRQAVPLYGDGLNVRDWIHVEDHNIAAHLVLEQGSPARSTTSGPATR